VGPPQKGKASVYFFPLSTIRAAGSNLFFGKNGHSDESGGHDLAAIIG
jgi:hypothetical protein